MDKTLVYVAADTGDWHILRTETPERTWCGAPSPDGEEWPFKDADDRDPDAIDDDVCERCIAAERANAFAAQRTE